MTTNNRLKEMRKSLKLTQRELGRRLGIQDTAISKIENGENNLTEQMLLAVCRTFDVNETWLRTGEGLMFVETDDTIIAALVAEYGLDELDRQILETYTLLPEDKRAVFKEYIVQLARSVERGEYSAELAADDEFAISEPFTNDEECAYRELPHSLLPASAGTGVFLDENSYELVTVGSEVPRSADYGVPVSGDSMEPDYPDGCTAWIEPSVDLRVGEVGLFLYNGNGYIKELGVKELISRNPGYGPLVINDSVRFDVCGRVVAVTGR